MKELDSHLKISPGDFIDVIRKEGKDIYCLTRKFQDEKNTPAACSYLRSYYVEFGWFSKTGIIFCFLFPCGHFRTRLWCIAVFPLADQSLAGYKIPGAKTMDFCSLDLNIWRHPGHILLYKGSELHKLY